MTAEIQNDENFQHMNNNIFDAFFNVNYYEYQYELHHHDFYELYFFLDGDLNYIVENRTYRLVPGDILIINPLELHQPKPMAEPTSCERIIIWINMQQLIKISNMFKPLSLCFDTTQPNHTNLLRLDTTSREKLTPLVDTVVSETNNNKYANDAIAFGCLVQLLTELNRYALLPQKKYEVIKNSTPIINEVVRYINTNYTDELSLDFLADKFFISKYYLSHEFKQLIGISVHKFIIKKRLAISMHMISKGIQPTIAYKDCGFGDYTSFYRAFKQNYGLSPKEYAISTKNTNI